MGNSSTPVNGSTDTNGSMPVNGTDNSTSNVSTGEMVICCDYYEKGAGYEFTVCSGDIGAIIIPDRISGTRDLFWAK